MGDIVQITDADFADGVLGSDTPVLVDFWAPWCGPCRMMEPVLHEIAAEHGEKITIAKLNVDENPETAQRYDILSIPTLLVFDKGEMVKKLVGAMPKKRLLDELSQWVG